MLSFLKSQTRISTSFSDRVEANVSRLILADLEHEPLASAGLFVIDVVAFAALDLQQVYFHQL